MIYLLMKKNVWPNNPSSHRETAWQVIKSSFKDSNAEITELARKAAIDKEAHLFGVLVIDLTAKNAPIIGWDIKPFRIQCEYIVHTATD